jgi:hypothetical protein
VLPALPFLYLALANGLVTMAGGARAIVQPMVMVGALGSYAFFAPVLYAVPLPYDAWRDRILFDSCGDAVGVVEIDGTQRMVPEFEVVPAPRGWCWL